MEEEKYISAEDRERNSRRWDRNFHFMQISFWSSVAFSSIFGFCFFLSLYSFRSNDFQQIL